MLVLESVKWGYCVRSLLTGDIINGHETDRRMQEMSIIRVRSAHFFLGAISSKKN